MHRVSFRDFLPLRHFVGCLISAPLFPVLNDCQTARGRTVTFWPGLQPFLACLSHPAHCPLPLGGRASASHLGPRQALPSCSGAGGQQGPGAPPRPQPEIVQQPPELLLGEQAHKPEPGSLPRAQGHCRQPAALLGGDRGGGCTGSVAAALATSDPGLPGGLGLWSRQTRTVCGR